MEVDAIVIGTGLTESIAAAALSKAGYSIAHIDANPYYGGDDASLTLDELVEWADRRSTASGLQDTYQSAQLAKFTSIIRSPSVPSQSRQYSLSLAPSIIPSVGPLIGTLITSGVSRYGGFKLLERVAIFDAPGRVKPVPGSKEDVFKDKELSLLDKRRLMRFLMFAGGDFEGKTELEGNEQTPFIAFLHDKFSLDNKTAGAIAFALAFCMSDTDPTLPALQRVRQYLRSAGRYGSSPFLVGHYGGIGEIAQGFCRTAAVNGATYILGRPISTVSSLSDPEPSSSSGKRYNIELEGLAEQLHSDLILSGPDYITPPFLSREGPATTTSRNSYPITRCIAIIDYPVSFSTTGPSGDNEITANADIAEPTEETDEVQEEISGPVVDTALLVFPPSSLPNGSATVAAQVLITGEGSMSTPKDKWVLYISLPLLDAEARTQTAEHLLRPYVDATLSLTTRPSDCDAPHALFTLFYIQQPPTSSPSVEAHSALLLTPPCAPLMSERGDSAATEAETMFWKAVGALKAAGRRPRAKDGEEAGRDEARDVGAFWPPLDAAADETGDDW
ncbi:GDP dissociation inhibitor-domain-containing protein [Sparassis latifolia]